MAADYAAQPSDSSQPNDGRLGTPPSAPGTGGDSTAAEHDGEAHDLTYIRARRARASDPRRSLNATFGSRGDSPGPVALRRAASPAPAAPAPRSLLFGRSLAFWLLSAALFALVAGATFAIFYSRQTRAERAAVAPEVIHASVPVSSLQMHVAVQGGRVLVSWDPRASGVRKATGGQLTIEDAGRHHELSLDATQAANGSVLYRPASGDVTFSLQIRNASGAVFNDSLRVVDPAKAALLAQKKASAHPPQIARHVVPAISKPRPTRRVASAAASRHSETPRVQQAAVRKPAPFASDRKSRLAADPPLTMPAAAPVVLPLSQAADGSGAALTADIARHALVSEAPPPPAGIAAGEVIGTVARQDANGSKSGLYLPPRAVRQVMPRLPSSLVGTIAPGTKVGVLVRIDKRGRVKRARIAPDSRNIDIGVQKVALDAAKQWKFTPAWRDGKKIASEHTIVFQF